MQDYAKCLRYIASFNSFFFFIFKLYITVLDLPNIKMHPPQVYMCSPSWTLLPPPSSLPIPSLWVVPVHQPQASSIVHQTWASNLFHTWYSTCFNAILPNLPTLSLSHRVHKTVLFESVLMRWMKLAPIIQSEVSQKEKHQYSILMHIYVI